MREIIVILAFGDLVRLKALAESDKVDDRDVIIQLDEREGGLRTTELIRRCRELELAVPGRRAAGQRCRQKKSRKTSGGSSQKS
jgi:hypothetical protein